MRPTFIGPAIQGSSSKKVGYRVSPPEILQEVEQFHGVCLDALAGLHPAVSDGLAKISGSVRNTATLLEVMVRIKNRATARALTAYAAGKNGITS